MPDAGGRKTLVGTAACAIATFAGALFVAGLRADESFATAIAAAFAERFDGPIDDNLRIVVAVGATILLWRITFS